MVPHGRDRSHLVGVVGGEGDEPDVGDAVPDQGAQRALRHRFDGAGLGRQVAEDRAQRVSPSLTGELPHVEERRAQQQQRHDRLDGEDAGIDPIEDGEEHRRIQRQHADRDQNRGHGEPNAAARGWCDLLEGARRRGR